MENSSNLKSITVAVALLFALGWGIYLFISALVTKLSTIEGDLSKTLVASAATVTVAVTTLAFGKLWEQRQKLRQDLREKKIPIYEDQLKTLFRVMMAEKRGEKPPSEQEIMRAFSQFTERLIVWGSSDVIRAWVEFRTKPFGDDPQAGLLRIEAILRAIRKDLGENLTGLKHGDLLRLFVNDVPANFPAAKPPG
jgi:hypothetical protein